MEYTLTLLGWLFMIYSFLGWCVRVIAEAVRRKTFVNPGVLNLPLCPFFGTAALIFSIFLIELKHNLFFLFIGGLLLTAFLCYVNNMVLHHIFHRNWTDDRGHRLGLTRYITGPLLLLGGLGAVFVLWAGNPLLLRLINFIPKTIRWIVLLVLSGVTLADLLATLAIVWDWRRNIDRISAMTDSMENMTASFGNALTRVVCRRLEHSYPNIETGKLLRSFSDWRKQRREKTKFAEGCSFSKLVIIFLLTSFLGDLAETIFCRISMGYWMSRSSLVFGPFSVIWGLACVLLTLFLYGHRNDRWIFIFLYGTVVGGAYEYVCSIATQLMFGASFWNYSKIPLNLGGRINLFFCFLWGLASVVWLKGIYPHFSKAVEKIPARIGKIIVWITVVFFAADGALSAAALGRYSERQQDMTPNNRFEIMLDQYFPDQKMEKIYPKMESVDRKDRSL